MPSEANFILPFITLSTVALVLISVHRKAFSLAALSLLVGYIGLDTFLEWNSLKIFSETLMNQSQKAFSVLVTFSALLIMTSQKRLLDLTVNFFIILPLLLNVALTANLFYFTVNASLVLAFTYYQVTKDLSQDLLKSVMRSAYLEIIFILIFGLTGLFTVSIGQLGHELIFPYIVSALFSYLYILIQGPLNVKLIQDGLTSNKALSLAIPKSIICVQLILLSHELFGDLEIPYKEGLSDFIFLSSSILLGVLAFLATVFKSREKYSILYVISQFTMLAGLVALGMPSGNTLLLIVLLLDTVISFSVLIKLKKRSLTGFLYGLNSTLLPVGIVFFSKLILIRFIIIESEYHPYSYLVLINQVCLTVAALKLISMENIGKINLSPRHAVYLSCVIISACLMAILN